jgi:hypothetical protein
MQQKLVLSIIVWSLLLVHTDGFSQADKKLVFKAFVLTQPQTKRMVGILQEVRDSSIVIISKEKEIEIPSVQIQEIKIRRKGAVGNSAGVGALIGVGTGVVLGIASGDDNPDNMFALTAVEKSVMYGFLLSLPGALVGSVFGMSYEEKIKINFNQTLFQDKMTTLKKYQNPNSYAK